VIEELDELAAAATPEEKLDEAGDLLFAAVNLARAHGVAPEEALRHANAKFERRFRAMEALAQGAFPTLDLEAQEALWQAVKATERQA
jgi:ATP diphosphatase